MFQKACGITFVKQASHKQRIRNRVVQNKIVEWYFVCFFMNKYK